MQIAKESGHYYEQDGSPAYKVPYADKSKGMRNTTLRDARKLSLVPSVTTILKVLPKPGLDNWKQEPMFYAALTLTRQDEGTDEQFYGRVVHDSREQARKAAEKGIAIHGAIQRAIEGKSFDTQFGATVMAVMEWLDKEFDKTQWISERTFAHPLGFGGAVDLHSPQIIIDLKTKDFDQADIDNGKIKGWPEQGMQLAAYREGVGHPKVKRINLFISRNNPGLIVPYYWDEDDKHWETFLALLNVWKLTKNYDGSFNG